MTHYKIKVNINHALHAQAPPPRELTATELLEQEKSAAATPTANGHGAGPNGAVQGGPAPSAFGAQSNNPFGEQSTFGQPQQQPQQQQSSNFGSGAVVPYGAPTGYGQSLLIGHLPSHFPPLRLAARGLESLAWRVVQPACKVWFTDEYHGRYETC